MAALQNVVAKSALVAALGVLAACGQQAPAGAPPGAGGGPPPAEVGVVTVAPRAVGLATELPGRLEASRVAQVRARAAGILQKRLFKEGSDVTFTRAAGGVDVAVRLRESFDFERLLRGLTGVRALTLTVPVHNGTLTLAEIEALLGPRCEQLTVLRRLPETYPDVLRLTRWIYPERPV